jgi:hypothetical protein
MYRWRADIQHGIVAAARAAEVSGALAAAMTHTPETPCA